MNIVNLSYSTDIEPFFFKEKVGKLVEHLRTVEQTDCPVEHHFSPGLYLREIFMPAGTVVVGRVHKTEHFNILVKGACYIVHDDGSREELRAPRVFVSKPGVQKVLYIIEDMIWMTTHVTDETDVALIEPTIVEPIPFDRRLT